MTERTRWIALAEELATEDTAAKLEEKVPLKKLQPKLSPEGEATTRAILDEYAPRLTTNVIVSVDGMVIEVTDVKLNWSASTDYELMRLGVLTPEEVRRQPVQVTGSFHITRRDLSLSGKELMILVVRGREVVKFLAHVRDTLWRSDDPVMEVGFVGMQVG